MSIEEALLHLKVDGWYIVDGVIPEGKVDAVRQSVEATAASHGVRECEVEGVLTTRGLIAFDQSFAPYLADQRVSGLNCGRGKNPSIISACEYP